MQTLSSPYQDIYLLCEKIINDALTSKKQIHLRSFYNTYRAVHKFNKWLDNLIKSDFEKLFKEKYFENNMTIEKLEQTHYWETFVIFVRGERIMTHLLKKLRKLRYISNGSDTKHFLMDQYMEKEKSLWIAKFGYVCGRFDEVSIMLRRNALVIREGTLVIEEMEYDFANNRIQFSEASKTILKYMIVLENSMASYLCKDARIENVMFHLVGEYA